MTTQSVNGYFPELVNPQHGQLKIEWVNSDEPKKWIVTLWLFNIAMENDPFIDDFPIKNGDFPWLC